MSRMFLVIALAIIFAPVASAEDEEWGSGKTVIVTDDQWSEFRQKNPAFLAAFFAPWCGHCKKLAPEYGQAAEELQFRVPLVAVDCTADGKATCGQFDVKGFPTMKWFSTSDGDAEEYDGGRTANAIVKFVTDKVGDEPENFDNVDFNTFKIKQLKKLLFDRGQDCAGCAEKKDFVKKVKASIHLPKTGPKRKKSKKFEGTSLVNGMTVAQERRYKEAKKVADEGWEENGAVVHLVEHEFETYRKEKGAIFTMFYAPWCGHCKAFKPAMAEASTELKDVLPVTAVDCVTNPELCRKYKAMSYPTLTFFPDAESTGVAFGGSRTAAGLVKWLKKKMNPETADVVEPFVNEPAWEENGDVIHMTGEHWDEYRKTNPKMFVLFYAPWCGHCKAIKPDWATASSEVKDVMPMLAVDCTEHTDLCSQFDVKGYPTLKYFDSSDGKAQEYNGGRKHDDFVSYVKSKAGAGEKEEL